METSKYKIGDRVRVLNKGFLAGKIGTVVICERPECKNMVGIDFGEVFDFNYIFTHTLDGLLKDRTGRWIACDNLEKVEGGLVVELL